MKENDVRLLIPENLDIDKIIDKNRDLYFQKFNKYKALVIVDSIIKARIVQRKKMDTQFANVSSKKLKALVQDYRMYLTFLLEAGIVSTDNRFIEGKKSKGYCINSPYSGEKLITIPLTDYKLRKAIKRVRAISEKERKKSLWGYGYLTKWWDTEKLVIDVDGALLFIKEDLSQKIDRINRDSEIKDKKARIAQAKDTAEDFRYLVHTLKGKTYIGFSGDGKRFYNPVTNLKRGLRRFLTYDGQTLVEIDVKNCQPFLSIALFDEDFWKPYDKVFGEKLNLERMDKGLYDKIFNLGIVNDIITFLNSSKTHASKGFQIKKYTEYAIGEDFYKSMQECFVLECPKEFKDRDSTKLEMMKILYMDNHTQQFPKPSIAFKNKFPEVFGLFRIIRSVKEHENLLAIILQRIESYLVIEKTCKRLSIEYPGIPLFTIHDSILTAEGNEYTVDNILREEIKKYIGYQPRTRLKPLYRQNHAA